MARTPDPKLHAIWRDAHSPAGSQRFDHRAVLLAGRHRQVEVPRLETTLPACDAADQCPALPSPSSFLPVTVRLLQHGPTEPPPIEADLPNGVRLRIPTADPHLACRIIRTVAAASTNSGGTR